MKIESGKMNVTRRKPIQLAADNLVKQSYLDAGPSLPVLYEPIIEGLNLIQWLPQNLVEVLGRLRSSGGILFRGFTIRTAPEFEQFMTLLAGDLIDYSYRSTPRTQVSGKIYTSTEYPAHQTIPLHNEMSYSRQWPMIIGLFCVEPPAKDGETPIADSRKVYAGIDV